MRVSEARGRLKNPVQRAFVLCKLPMDAKSDRGAVPMTSVTRQMSWRKTLDEVCEAAAVEWLDTAEAAHEREDTAAAAQHRLGADLPRAATRGH